MKTGIGQLAVSIGLALSMFFLGVGPTQVTTALADEGECTCCQIDEPPTQEANKAVSIALASEELHAWRAVFQKDGLHFDVGQRDVVFLGGDENYQLYRIAFLPSPFPPDEVWGVVITVDTVAEDVVGDARIDISAADEDGSRTITVQSSNSDSLAVLGWEAPPAGAVSGDGGGGPTPQELYCYWEYYQWGPPCYFCCSGTSCSLVCCNHIWPGCQTWPCVC